MRLEIVDHLKLVLQIAQEQIGPGQCRLVAGGEQPIPPESSERTQGAALAETSQPGSAQCLDRLHKKLDLPCPA